MNKIFTILEQKWKAFDRFHKDKAIEPHKRELEELQNIFALLVCGNAIGFPFAPLHIQAELLPFLEPEMDIMYRKIDTSNDALAELFSVFDIG
jgi:hypothetical protein